MAAQFHSDPETYLDAHPRRAARATTSSRSARSTRSRSRPRACSSSGSAPARRPGGCSSATPTPRSPASTRAPRWSSAPASSGIEVRLARMQDPLPDGPWDLVISVLAVHHLDDDGKRDLFRRVREQSRALVLGDVVAAEPQSVPLEPGVDLLDARRGPGRVERRRGRLAGRRPRGDLTRRLRLNHQGGGRCPKVTLREARPDRLRDDQPARGAQRDRPRRPPADDRDLGRLPRRRLGRRGDPHRSRRRRVLRRRRPQDLHPADHARTRARREIREIVELGLNGFTRGMHRISSRSSAPSTAGRSPAASRRRWPATSGSPPSGRCSAPSRPGAAFTTATAGWCGSSTPAASGRLAHAADRRAGRRPPGARVGPGHEGRAARRPARGGRDGRAPDPAQLPARGALGQADDPRRHRPAARLPASHRGLERLHLRRPARRRWRCSAASTRRPTPAGPASTRRGSKTWAGGARP